MESYSYVDGFTGNGFAFSGGFCFGCDQSDYHYILGKNGCSININTELLKSLYDKKPSDELVFKLVQHGLASVEGKPVPRDEYEDLKIGARELDSSFFIIDITQKCNLKCIYCFRNLNDNRTIDESTLEDICRFILETAKKKNRSCVNIQMWGGEPLLAFDRIVFVKNFFDKTDIQAVINIETNGTLINDEIAEKLYKMHIMVGVSIDGLPEHQNRQRKLANHGDSMPMVEKGIQSLKKYYGDEIGGITVITKHNFRDISKIIKYYKYTLGISCMKFNIVKDNPNAGERSLGLTPLEVHEFAEELCDLVELYNALGVSFIEGNIQTRATNLTERAGGNCCDSNGCKGGQALISIDAKGGIYPCDLTDCEEFNLGKR